MKHDPPTEAGVADPNESYYRELDELSAVEWRRSR
jgi:hypothetical protein